MNPTRSEVLAKILSMDAVTRKDLHTWFGGEANWKPAVDELMQMGILRERKGVGVIWVTRWDGVNYV